MSDEERALLAAIIAEPDDDTPRLVYADWLDEHGRPERAEFIRVQIERDQLVVGAPSTEARWKVLEDRDRELMAAHHRTWAKAFAETMPKNRQTHFWFHRGMIGEVWCTPKYFCEAAETLISAAPIEEVYFRRPTALSLREALRVPAFQRIRSLKFSADEVTPNAVRTAVAAPIDHLRGLVLSSNVGYAAPPPGWAERSAEAVELISESQRFSRLRRLDLRLAGVGDNGAAALATSEYLTGLRVLLLTGNPLSPESREHLRSRFGSAVYFDYFDYRGRLTGADLR